MAAGVVGLSVVSFSSSASSFGGGICSRRSLLLLLPLGEASMGMRHSDVTSSSPLIRRDISYAISRKASSKISCARSSDSQEEDPSDNNKAPFGYTRKDVILIGLGVTLAGFGSKTGLEYFGVDPLKAGNAVQLIIVLGLIVGWISTYMFRVSNKEMTYAQQLRDYENKVMQKRLDGLTEAELEELLQQVEEEKQRPFN